MSKKKSVDEKTVFTQYNLRLETLMFEYPHGAMCVLAKQTHNSLVVSSLGFFTHWEIREYQKVPTLWVEKKQKDADSYFQEMIALATGFEIDRTEIKNAKGQDQTIEKTGEVYSFGEGRHKIRAMASYFKDNEIVISIPPDQYQQGALSYYKQIGKLYPIMTGKLQQVETFRQIIMTGMNYSLSRPKTKEQDRRKAWYEEQHPRWCPFCHWTRPEFRKGSILPGYDLFQCPSCNTYHLIHKKSGHLMPLSGDREGERYLLQKREILVDKTRIVPKKSEKK